MQIYSIGYVFSQLQVTDRSERQFFIRNYDVFWGLGIWNGTEAEDGTEWYEDD